MIKKVAGGYKVLSEKGKTSAVPTNQSRKRKKG